MARPAALARGTEVRSRRAELKRRVAAGRLDLERLLRGDAQEADETTALDIRVGELLRAIPGIGETTADAIVDATPCGLDARLGTLTLKRRLALADALRKETHG